MRCRGSRPRGAAQTVLVSATLDKKVRELAHTQLANPVLASDADDGTKEGGGIEDAAPARVVGGVRQFELPSKLRQHFMVAPCKRRLLALCAFLRQRSVPSTRNCKAIVFVSSVAEVKCLSYLLARAVLPAGWKGDTGDVDHEADSEDEEEAGGTALLNLPVHSLHGDMPQKERTAAFFSFTGSHRAVLVCTDVAARGLDFPRIDWIIQYDPPQDVEEYVHRCGRTARMTTEGDALLFLMPHEEPYVKRLAEHGLRLTPLPEHALRTVLKRGAAHGRGGGSRDRSEEDMLALQRGLEDIVATVPEVPSPPSPTCARPVSLCAPTEMLRARGACACAPRFAAPLRCASGGPAAPREKSV